MVHEKTYLKFLFLFFFFLNNDRAKIIWIYKYILINCIQEDFAIN